MSTDGSGSALAPPAGVESNFEDPSNKHAMIIGVMVMYIVLTTIFTLSRMWTRFYVHQELWWDDWTMFVGWIGIVGLAAAQLIQLKYGAGVDMWNVTKGDYAEFERVRATIGSYIRLILTFKVFSNIEIVARLSIFFAKLSILLLYLRIFFPKRTQKTPMWWWIWAVIWFNLLYTIALVLVVTLQCAPYGLPFGSTCLNEYAVLISASVINVLSDIAVLLVPLEGVWKLQMARNQKAGLIIIFSLGALAPLSSIARLGYQIPEALDENRTMLLVTVNILAMAENVIAVMVGCMPVLAVWFFHLQSKRGRRVDSKSLSARFRPTLESRPSISRPQRGRSTRRVGQSDPYPLTAMDDIDEDGDSPRTSRVCTSSSQDAGFANRSASVPQLWASIPPIYGVSPPTTTTIIQGGRNLGEERSRRWGSFA